MSPARILGGVLAPAWAAVRAGWGHLRCWSGDDAYERYCARHAGHGHALPDRAAFYRDYIDQRGSRPRCC